MPKRYAIYWTIFIAVITYSMHNCYASCKGSETFKASLISFNLPSSLSLSSDVDDGSVIWRSEWLSTETNLPFCDLPQTVMLNILNTFVPADGAAFKSYQTGIDGLILKIYYRDRTRWIHEHALVAGEVQKIRIDNSSSRVGILTEFRLELIKIHHIKTGLHHVSGGLVTLKVDGVPVTNLVVNPMAMYIRTAGCDVRTDNLVVNLGEHDQKEFTGKGSTTPYKPFYVTLRCEENVKINYAVRGKGVNGSTNGVLSLDKVSGSAQGIGVQIADVHSRPVKLNQYTMWQDKNTEGVVQVGFKVRYIQTDSIISAGKANATATISFIYR